MRMRRKEDYHLPCNEKKFFTVVKTAFNQRRKTLRNSLKSLNLPEEMKNDEILNLRPEQLDYQDFIYITQKLEANGV